MTTAASPSEVTSEVRGFFRRLTLAFAWGHGLDGFDLGIISVILPVITRALGLNPIEAGLIGASSLIGIFVGAPLAGRLADRFGRKLVFSIDIGVLIVLNLLQAFVSEPWQLIAIRVALGVAIGAEYTIAAAMLAEFTPSRGRGRRISALLVCWFAGYLAAVVLSYLLVGVAGVPWHWVLPLGAIPAIVTFLLRIGVPESPRWLLNHGREEEARTVVENRLGGESYFIDEDFAAEQPHRGGFRELFSPNNRRRVVFLSVFWACNVAPYFAILTFAPTVLRSLRLANEAAGTITINGMAAAGALIGMLTIERIGRRRQIIPPFWIMAAALSVIGIWSDAPALVVVACFAIFTFFNAAQANLTAVYPIEILPTEVRSTGVGFAAACSRIGAAIGTFLLPIGLDTIGTGICMLIAAAVCVTGAILSQKMAPETTGQNLAETSRTPVALV